MVLATVESVAAEALIDAKKRQILTLDRAYMLIVALAACLTRGINLANYPRWFVDEGVYVSQAWAVLRGQLAPYTYWYDHPPLGWIQIAGWFGLTGALNRNQTSILAGRELMVVCATATALLVYLLARKLHFRAHTALSAALLWVLSPLAMTYSRYTLLDNIAIVWVLASLVLLASGRKLATVALSALCMAAAVLSKETFLLLLPAWLLLGWQKFRNASNRVYAFLLSGSVVAVAGLMYPLYAAVKGELLPGAGHVSLWDGQIAFQLTNRQGSGSILDPNSNAFQLARYAWFGLDAWLPLAGLLLMIPCLFIRRLRVVAVALFVQVAILLRGGYVPYPFIIGLLPFMALLIAGVIDALFPRVGRHGKRYTVRTLVAATACFVTAIMVLPPWSTSIKQFFVTDDSKYQRQALAWVVANIDPKKTVVSEGEIWLDMLEAGFTNPQVVWTYKVDTDPAVKAAYGSTGLDYLVINQETLGQYSAYPTLYEAAQKATRVVQFGEGNGAILVLKVNKNGK